MPTSRSKKRSTRSATSKSQTNKATDVVETLENDNASTSKPELPSTTHPDLAAPEPGIICKCCPLEDSLSQDPLASYHLMVG